MLIRDTFEQYGLITIVLHWLTALLVLGLYILGLYMTSLDYYDRWYQLAPDIHRSAGVLSLFIILFRIIWRINSINPSPLHDMASLAISAKVFHYWLYLLLILLPISGYLVSTAEGQEIQVFDLFSIPAVYTGIMNQEDVMGDIHEWLAHGLIVSTILHAIAGLGHHYVKHDRTLIRILKP